MSHKRANTRSTSAEPTLHLGEDDCAAFTIVGTIDDCAADDDAMAWDGVAVSASPYSSSAASAAAAASLLPVAPRDPPLAVHQTDFTAGSGNALQACVASLFGSAGAADTAEDVLARVPNFVTLPSYLEGIVDFVGPHFTVRKVALQTAALAGSDVGALCILRGKSPRGAHGHVVIARVISGGGGEGGGGEGGEGGCGGGGSGDRSGARSGDSGGGGVEFEFEMVFDPHPDGTCLDSPDVEPFGWAMFFDRA